MNHTRLSMGEHLFNYMWQQYGELRLVRNYYAVVIASAHRTRVVDKNVDAMLAFLDGRWGLEALNIFLTAYLMLEQSKVGRTYGPVVMQEPRAMRGVAIQREDLRRCLAVMDAVLGPIHPQHRRDIVDELKETAFERPIDRPPSKGYTASELADWQHTAQETTPHATQLRHVPVNVAAGPAQLARVASRRGSSRRSSRRVGSASDLSTGVDGGRGGGGDKPGGTSRPRSHARLTARSVASEGSLLQAAASQSASRSKERAQHTLRGFGSLRAMVAKHTAVPSVATPTPGSSHTGSVADGGGDDRNAEPADPPRTPEFHTARAAEEANNGGTGGPPLKEDVVLPPIPTTTPAHSLVRVASSPPTTTPSATHTRGPSQVASTPRSSFAAYVNNAASSSNNNGGANSGLKVAGTLDAASNGVLVQTPVRPAQAAPTATRPAPKSVRRSLSIRSLPSVAGASAKPPASSSPWRQSTPGGSHDHKQSSSSSSLRKRALLAVHASVRLAKPTQSTAHSRAFSSPVARPVVRANDPRRDDGSHYSQDRAALPSPRSFMAGGTGRGRKPRRSDGGGGSVGGRPVSANGTATMVNGMLWGASHLHSGTVSARPTCFDVIATPALFSAFVCFCFVVSTSQSVMSLTRLLFLLCGGAGLGCGASVS